MAKQNRPVVKRARRKRYLERKRQRVREAIANARLK